MSHVFELPQELNIYSALETRDALLAWIAKRTAKNAGVLEISANNVSEIDGAGLQVLAALANMDRPWHIIEPSAPFSDACNVMGFAGWIDAGYVRNTTQVAA